MDSNYVDAIISNCSHLRVLDLTCLITKTLPDKLGKLLHLRYLNLSYNDDLEMLPKSITKLHNLQTLKLYDCWKLKELPEDTRKLVNLRVLDVDKCYRLTHMPAGMGKLTCLHSLTSFIVCGDDELGQYRKGKLVDLIALISNLRGNLYIKHYKGSNNIRSSHCMEVKLKSSKLKCQVISNNKGGQESLLKNLYFSHQFHKMKVENYAGIKLPSWALGLVSIHLKGCNELQYIPSSLSQLCHLKCLKLACLKNVVYIESDAPSPSAIFFPSLEKLELFGMQKLKGWWRHITWMEKEAAFIPLFPQLCVLSIKECKILTFFPSCPHVKELCLYNVNEALKFCVKGGGVQSIPISLEKLTINNSTVFNSLFREFVTSAVCIKLSGIENLGTIREGFQRCASSVRDLGIREDCRGVENLGIEQFTNLKSFRLLAYDLEGIEWKSLQSLTSMEIMDYNVVCLPKGIQYLTSLQSLILSLCDSLEDLGECLQSLASLQLLKMVGCTELKSLPEEMRHLTSLTTLTMSSTSNKIRDRCQPGREDWPKICHIPNLIIYHHQHIYGVK